MAVVMTSLAASIVRFGGVAIMAEASAPDVSDVNVLRIG